MPFLLDYRRADRVSTVLVQQALVEQGYTPGPADGRFGLQTMRAVVAFQKAHDLKETGAVDDGLYQSIVTGKKPPTPKPAKKAAAKKAPAAKAPADVEASADVEVADQEPAAKKTPAKKPAAKKVSS